MAERDKTSLEDSGGEDVEGHIPRARKAEDVDDAEGHAFRRQDTESDTEGHGWRPPPAEGSEDSTGEGDEDDGEGHALRSNRNLKEDSIPVTW